MGTNPRSPYLLELYQEFRVRQDSGTFARRASNLYTVGTLERLAHHPQREVRRAAVLALGFLGDYEVNHTLGCALVDEDRAVRLIADTGIRSVWARAGTEAERRQIGEIIQINTAQMSNEALRLATKLIHRAPWFAEAWHQRAIAHAALEHFVETIRDCHQALEINPYHFIAATRMGQAYLDLENPISALECFRRALRLNPNLEGVRAQVARLSRMVEDSR
jgi:tetratricopeptide (TPR) repeat protein